ncbi:uncharacterized protein LY89DRAFT_682410 [Mollisia scopiformis]|uniref:Uncharacterized protein n=1 Tax=Mollisia scopiformis TaxID=149040 RepID=A0A194XKU3_MOLSC|nr:uncharacterized protein LY89DRAFT_682410 [Mollisia scopiformis]KUJ20714.1 hypothetical protein LY89DRAFT_682410 [Mollisia scopiformis]
MNHNESLLFLATLLYNGGLVVALLHNLPQITSNYQSIKSLQAQGPETYCQIQSINHSKDIQDTQQSSTNSTLSKTTRDGSQHAKQQ